MTAVDLLHQKAVRPKTTAALLRDLTTREEKPKYNVTAFDMIGECNAVLCELAGQKQVVQSSTESSESPDTSRFDTMS